MFLSDMDCPVIGQSSHHKQQYILISAKELRQLPSLHGSR